MNQKVLDQIEASGKVPESFTDLGERIQVLMKELHDLVRGNDEGFALVIGVEYPEAIASSLYVPQGSSEKLQACAAILSDQPEIALAMLLAAMQGPQENPFAALLRGVLADDSNEDSDD